MRVHDLENDRELDFTLIFRGGFAHAMPAIGLIRYLQENKIKPRAVVGASMGAQLAAAYSAGKRWDEMYDDVKNFDFSDLMSLRSFFLGHGIYPQEKVKAWFQERLGVDRDLDFTEFTIPLGIFVTDLETGEKVLMTSGNAFDAAMASSAYPLLIERTQINGHDYIDGDLVGGFGVGLVRNTFPSKTVMGVEAKSSDKPGKFTAITRRFASRFKRRFTKQNQDLPLDVHITFEVGNLTPIDFAAMLPLIDEVHHYVVQNRRQLFSKVHGRNPIKRFFGWLSSLMQFSRAYEPNTP